MIFEGCKGAKIEKTDKSTQNPGFNPLFCKVEIAFYVNISEKVIIFKKKARKSEKKRIFLPKYFSDTEKSRIFAVHSGNKDAYLTHRNPYITMLRSLTYLHVSVVMKRLLFAAVILFTTDSANVR